MIEYLNGYTLAIGAAVLAVFAWWLLRVPKMPAEASNIQKMNIAEPVQKYDKFPEPKPKPMKTIETRDGTDIPY